MRRRFFSITLGAFFVAALPDVACVETRQQPAVIQPKAPIDVNKAMVAGSGHGLRENAAGLCKLP
jgi:hypothetical protein